MDTSASPVNGAGAGAGVPLGMGWAGGGGGGATASAPGHSSAATAMDATAVGAEAGLHAYHQPANAMAQQGAANNIVMLPPHGAFPQSMPTTGLFPGGAKRNPDGMGGSGGSASFGGAVTRDQASLQSTQQQGLVGSAPLSGRGQAAGGPTALGSTIQGAVAAPGLPAPGTSVQGTYYSQLAAATAAAAAAAAVQQQQHQQQAPPGALPPPPVGPRRALTKPSQGTKNDGFDNEHSDLVLYTGDCLLHHNPGSGISRSYMIQEMLGQGTFGQVVSCWSDVLGCSVAVKVIKNQPAYYHQARVEIGLLQFLNARCDPNDTHHIVRMIDFFLFRKHLCLVFEKLDVNLFELLKRNSFRGLSLSLVQMFLRQLLDALSVLRDAAIIHCDLKPENILLVNPSSGDIKLIDYGSACFENRTVYSYIQSRFYRSPEVVLGTSYNVSIDMWSLGCVAAELFLGLPLFPGASEHDLLTRITETLGPLPSWLLGEAKHTEKYFKRVPLGGSQNPVGIAMSPSGGGDVGLSLSSSVAGAGGAWDHLASSVPRHVQPPPFPQSLTSARGPQQGAPSQWGASGNHHAAQVAGDAALLSTSAPPAGGASRWVLRTAAEFEARNGCKAPAGKRYFQHTRLADIIAAYPLRSGLSDEEVARERLAREAFIDFLLGVLDTDPRTRWTPRQAAAHPFITGAPFTGPFQPSPDPRGAAPLMTPGTQQGTYTPHEPIPIAHPHGGIAAPAGGSGIAVPQGSLGAGALGGAGASGSGAMLLSTPPSGAGFMSNIVPAPGALGGAPASVAGSYSTSFIMGGTPSKRLANPATMAAGGGTAVGAPSSYQAMLQPQQAGGLVGSMGGGRGQAGSILGGGGGGQGVRASLSYNGALGPSSVGGGTSGVFQVPSSGMAGAGGLMGQQGSSLRGSGGAGSLTQEQQQAAAAAVHAAAHAAAMATLQQFAQPSLLGSLQGQYNLSEAAAQQATAAVLQQMTQASAMAASLQQQQQQQQQALSIAAHAQAVAAAAAAANNPITAVQAPTLPFSSQHMMALSSSVAAAAAAAAAAAVPGSSTLAGPSSLLGPSGVILLGSTPSTSASFMGMAASVGSGPIGGAGGGGPRRMSGIQTQPQLQGLGQSSGVGSFMGTQQLVGWPSTAATGAAGGDSSGSGWAQQQLQQQQQQQQQLAASYLLGQLGGQVDISSVAAMAAQKAAAAALLQQVEAQQQQQQQAYSSQQQQQQPGLPQPQGFYTGAQQQQQQQQQPLSQSVPSQGPSGSVGGGSYVGIPTAGGTGASLHHLSDSSMNNGQAAAVARLQHRLASGPHAASSSKSAGGGVLGGHASIAEEGSTGTGGSTGAAGDSAMHDAPAGTHGVPHPGAVTSGRGRLSPPSHMVLGGESETEGEEGHTADARASSSVAGDGIHSSGAVVAGGGGGGAGGGPSPGDWDPSFCDADLDLEGANR